MKCFHCGKEMGVAEMPFTDGQLCRSCILDHVNTPPLKAASVAPDGVGDDSVKPNPANPVTYFSFSHESAKVRKRVSLFRIDNFDGDVMLSDGSGEVICACRDFKGVVRVMDAIFKAELEGKKV